MNVMIYHSKTYATKVLNNDEQIDIIIYLSNYNILNLHKNKKRACKIDHHNEPIHTKNEAKRIKNNTLYSKIIIFDQHIIHSRLR
jgi:anthranilate/para-aminobenzoate synthase component II